MRVANHQSGYEPDEITVTPEMIEAGVAKLLESGLVIPEYERSVRALRQDVAAIVRAVFGAERG